MCEVEKVQGKKLRMKDWEDTSDCYTWSFNCAVNTCAHLFAH